MIRNAMIVIVIVFLVGCTQSEFMATSPQPANLEPEETPNQTTANNPTSVEFTPTEVIIEQATQEATSIPVPFLMVDSQVKRLQPGLYLVYYDLETNDLVALSFQLSQTIIARSNQVNSHSNNVIHAQVADKLVNLLNKSETKLPEMDRQDCAISSISNSGEIIVMNCLEGEVYIIDGGENWTRLLTTNYSIEQPILSPDEEQLAFCLPEPTEEHKIGLNRINLEECLQNENCPFILIAPECEEGDFAWSPDANKMVVVNSQNTFTEYEFILGTRSELSRLPPDEKLSKILWSPDGRWITFSTQKSETDDLISSIYLMNVQVKEPRLFFELDQPVELVGWLNVVSPFQTGNHYVVLPSEKQYWLKGAPEEEAFNLKLLVAGERVRVLEKSEIVGSEHWWQVRVGDYTGWVKENSNHFQDDWMYGLQSPVFETGSRLIVKLSGNDLRLREMPSLNGAVKRYLQPGMRLLIVDGPAVVDQFNWWLIEIEGSKIYGWVVEEALWYATE